MDLIRFNAARCDLCGTCIRDCPFGALSMGERGIEVNENCRMCGLCVRRCPHKAITFEQKAGAVDKRQWRDFLIFVEQERGDIHPVAY
ncbi:MAG: 4Fe-4S binding protein, partial [Clostridiales bacterium]|nr:4Fe-4S binding protein [Clostridiales bacterium]